MACDHLGIDGKMNTKKKIQKQYFDFKLVGIPILNLRNEFNHYYILLFSDKIEKMISENGPIESHYFTWYRFSDEFFTLIVQKAILGIESYLPSAVRSEAFLREKKIEFDGNTFSLGSKNLAVNLYNNLPALVDPSWKLETCNPKVWNKTLEFYREVRNPLFHGKQFDSLKIQSVREMFDYLAEVYEWIDSWYEPNKILNGAGVFKGIREKFKKHGTNLKSIQLRL